jgi:hypothetical protein
MSLVAAPLTLLPMARRETAQERTQQVNFRLKTKTVERMERFKERHEIGPSLTQIVEAAVNAWLDVKEKDLPQKR